jgi:hypothetical protein
VPLPRSEIRNPRELTFPEAADAVGAQFVLQSAHGYGGRRTYLVSSPEEHAEATADIRAPECRIAEFVAGTPTTLNACVTARGVAVGPEIVQITGQPSLTPYELGSCGNDWEAALRLGFPYVDAADTVRRLGTSLAEAGYRGIFGVDLIRRPEGGLVVVEVNPRFVASIALHTQAEIEEGRLPLLARHLLAFMAPELDGASLEEHSEPLAGAQYIAYHTGPEPAEVSGAARTGAISLDRRSDQSAIRPALFVSELEGPKEALALAPAEGRRVRTGSEYLRLQMAAAPHAEPDALPTAIEDAVATLSAAVLLEH